MEPPEQGDVRVRSARIEDLEPLVALLGVLFDQEDEFVVEPAFQRDGLRALLSAPGRVGVLVAERDGRVLGMVSVQVVISTAWGGPVGILEDLVVEPSARGEGIGSMLLLGAFDQARHLDCRRLTLLTDAGNLAAQDLYQRHGFSPSTMIPMRREIEADSSAALPRVTGARRRRPRSTPPHGRATP